MVTDDDDDDENDDNVVVDSLGKTNAELLRASMQVRETPGQRCITPSRTSIEPCEKACDARLTHPVAASHHSSLTARSIALATARCWKRFFLYKPVNMIKQQLHLIRGVKRNAYSIDINAFGHKQLRRTSLQLTFAKKPCERRPSEPKATSHRQREIRKPL